MSDESLAVRRFDEGDYYLAFSGLQKLADKADVEGELRLGYMYQYGLGVSGDALTPSSRNELAAMQLFQRAANQGDPRGLVCMGVLYVQGADTSHDYAKAVQLFQEAARRGAPFAAYDLGGMYMEGWGVPKDEQKGSELSDNLGAATRPSIEAYINRMRTLIYRNIRYPTWVAATGSAGKVHLQFSVHDGAPGDVRVAQSSGNPEFDAQAVQAVKLSYFPPPPLGMMAPKNFLVVLNFSK